MSFKSTQQKGNIVKGKLKSQKELKKITSSDEYKKAGYQEKNKMLNVATHKRGALVGGQKKLDKNNNNRIDAQDFKILKAEKAKGRGMGLQDEKMKPGKVMKAKKGMSFSQKMKMVEEGKIDKKTGKFTSMEAMREAKGFKPGESAKDFNKKQMLKKEALKAAKATRLGKIVLPIAAAGVAASQYLKSKMKKKDKKMGGGMMQKYAEGGDASRSPMAEQQRRMGRRKPKPGPLGRAGRGVGKTAGRRAGIPSLPGKAKKNKPMVVIVGDNKKYSTGQGGIERDANNNPYRYSYDADPFLKDKTIVRVSNKSVGGSVTVKTKLGRNKPTKMY